MPNDNQAARDNKNLKLCKCIVFDWDGTLVDSLSGIIESVQHTAKQLNLPKVSDNEIRQGIGLGSSEQIMRLYGDQVEATDFKNIFEKHYYSPKSAKKNIAVFSGAEKTLYSLHSKGYILAVATGKGKKGLADEIDALNWQNLFQITCCAEEYTSKPSGAMVEHIIKSLSLSASEVVVIGDSHVDLEMAENAGALGIGVLTGVDSKATLSQKTHVEIINYVRDLDDLL